MSFKLKTFSGASHQNVKHWLRSVELAAVVEHWTTEHQLAAAYSLLTGQAASWVDHQVLRTRQEFKGAAITRFSDDLQVTIRKLLTVQQDRHEDVQAYLERVCTLVNMCEANGEMVPARMIEKLFVNGLSADIRQKVKDRCPLSLESAASNAMYFEGIYTHDGARAHATSMTSSPGMQRRGQGYCHPRKGRFSPPLRSSGTNTHIYAASACQQIDQDTLDDLMQIIDRVQEFMTAAHTSPLGTEADPATHVAFESVPFDSAHYLQDHRIDCVSPHVCIPDLAEDPLEPDYDDGGYAEPYDIVEADGLSESDWCQQQPSEAEQVSGECVSICSDDTLGFEQNSTIAYAAGSVGQFHPDFLQVEQIAKAEVMIPDNCVSQQNLMVVQQHSAHYQVLEPAGQSSALILPAKIDLVHVQDYKDDAEITELDVSQHLGKNHHDDSLQAAPVSQLRPAATDVAFDRDSNFFGSIDAAKDPPQDHFASELGKNQAGPYMTSNVPFIVPKDVLKKTKPGHVSPGLKMKTSPAIIAYLDGIIGACLLAADYLLLIEMAISLPKTTWDPGGATALAAVPK